MLTLNLEGKSALVTGGARGIGRAIVLKLAEAGARVAFTYRSSAEEAERLKQEIVDGGGVALAIQSDASSIDAAQESVQTVVDAWGSLDVLVNNAGITRDNLLIRMSPEDWEAVINTNLASVFNYARAVYRQMMKQRSGKIINMSSVVGVIGNPGQTNYAASKAGIIGFSKSLAKELAGRGVCVNVVAPGFVTTDMTEKLPEAARDAMLNAVPLGRPATPDDVANAVIFLASPSADYITGQVIHVDGGMVM